MGTKKRKTAATAAFNNISAALECGFFKPDTTHVVKRLREEVDELAVEAKAGNRAGMVDELGDVFFIAAQVAIAANVKPHQALHQANLKFERRFSYVLKALKAEGLEPCLANRQRMWELWDDAKKQEKKKTCRKAPLKLVKAA